MINHQLTPQLTNVNYLFNVMFKPGDTVTYESSRYGLAELYINEVRMVWTKDNYVIRYVGRPKYLQNPGRYTYKTAVTNNCKSLKLKETK